MSVEGVSKSSISRIKGISWNTVASWQQKAAEFASQANKNLLHGYELVELQADEICTFIDSRKKQTWIHTVLEVWSRLWIGSIVGRRNYRNVKKVISEAVLNGSFTHRFLFTTDGFEPYGWAVDSILEHRTAWNAFEFAYLEGPDVLFLRRRTSNANSRSQNGTDGPYKSRNHDVFKPIGALVLVRTRIYQSFEPLTHFKKG